MSETRPVRRFRFLFPGLILAGLALLGFLLPMIPQPGLHNRLERRLQDTVSGRVKLGETRLKIFPRPGIEVHAFSLADSGFELDLDKLELDFSLLSLLSFKPKISILHFTGGTAATATAKEQLPALLEGGLAALFPDAGLDRVSCSDLTVRCPEVPGMAGPLVFSGLQGEWVKLAGRGNESLTLTAACNGGRLDLKTIWYNDSGDAAGRNPEPGADRAPSEETSGVEVKLKLADARLNLASDQKNLDRGFREIVLDHSDLRLDLNGSVASGLRFSLDLKTPEHILTAFDENGDSRGVITRGALELKGSGYFQPRAGYLNLRSAALVLPGAAVVYSRGLVRFREPFFVDLVSHLKVDDLEKCGAYLSGILPAGFSVQGECTGDLKLVGNLFDVPVLKAELKADEITVQTGSEKRPAAAGPPSFSSLLDFLADWEWLAECDGRVKSLKWDAHTMKNFVLNAKKKTTMFEIERLAADFEPQGRSRLTLIVEDLLDNPRWQASLVAKKIDPSRWGAPGEFPPARLDLSLVGGGACGKKRDYLQTAELDGKWRLRQGRFKKQPLFAAFNRFLTQAGRRPWPGDFSGTGKVALRNGTLRLSQYSLKFPGRRQISGSGSCTFNPTRLNLRGRITEKGYQGNFLLQGDFAAPVFKTAGR